MITMGTAVFRRITEEYFVKGFDKARDAGIRALTDTMEETVRFGTFDKQARERCATDRIDHYMRDPNATCTNQVYPAKD